MPGMATPMTRSAAKVDAPILAPVSTWVMIPSSATVTVHSRAQPCGRRADSNWYCFILTARLCGASYEDIARAGGGIQSTVRASREATHESLCASAAARARRLMSEGVTTIEVKSGYGLELATERRLLEVARGLADELPVSIKTTYLGLHALPPEFRADRRRFVDQVSGPWLETLAAAGLVDAVDAFCENIAFTLAETEQFLRAAGR